MAHRILQLYILWSWYRSNCNGFKLAGIYDAKRSENSSVQSIDPFNDVAPLADSLSEGNPGNFVQLSHDLREDYVNKLDENE